jgi:putative membrane protein
MSNRRRKSEVLTKETPHREEKKKLILQLSPIDLLKIGVSQNHFRTAGVITLFFWSFLDDIEQAFNWKFMEAIHDYFENGSSFLMIFLMILPFFLIVSFLITLVSSVLRDYNLKFWKTETGFKIQSGLFNKKENSANLNKIQLLIWSSNPLKRIFKLFTLRMSQAASKAVSQKNAINIPGIYPLELEAVQQMWFPAQMHIDSEEHHISKLITWRKVLYQGVVPAIILVAIFWSHWGYYSLSWLLLIGYVYWWANQFYKTWIYEVSEEGLRTNSGVITRTHVLLQWYKIQGVRIRQGLYQQRKDVADLIFYTAAGSVLIPYVELEKAKMLRDFVIFKAEIDGREWM